MKTRILPFAYVLPLFLACAYGQSATPTSDPKTPAQKPSIVERYGSLPLVFEANQGQTDPEVKFVSRGTGYKLFLTANEAVLSLRRISRPDLNSPHAEAQSLQKEKSAVLHMKLVGANSRTTGVSGNDELPSKSNYFIGSDPQKWRTNVRRYARVHYTNLYPGVDLLYYGNQRQLEYDFVVQPGADPRSIRLGITGATKLRLDSGDLVLSSAGGDVRLRRPYTYQKVNGTKKEIRSHYVLDNKNEVGFRVATYDRGRPLIIDPVLAYSTYLGGSGDDVAIAIAVDSAGNAYVTGGTPSTDFPTANAIHPSYGGGSSDAFVTKINADGTSLGYSTYLGGNSNDGGQSIAVDSAGSVYLTGYTFSADFPTVNPIQPHLKGCCNAFVTKINAEGSALVYSTYLGGGGGESYGWGIAVDSAGNAHVTGDTRSHSFPVKNALQPNLRAQVFNSFISELNAAGSDFIYSTYWGGSVGEGTTRVAVDLAGNTYVVGYTYSPDFPTANAIQPIYGGGCCDAYLSKLSADGQQVLYSTFLGGSGDDATWAVAVDSAGNAYVAGGTNSTDFPTAHAIRPKNHGGGDAFVTKINPSGSAFVFSTYLGGSADDMASSIAADSAGNAYVGGYTNSTDFPHLHAIQPKNHGGTDAFVTKISSDGSALLYSTYLGGSASESYPSAGFRDLGIAVDSAGSVYVTGTSPSVDFPKTLLAFQPSLKAGADAFVTKIALQTFVSISPEKLTFPRQLVGTTSAAKSLTLSNQGEGSLTINKIYIAGANPGDFAETTTCVSSLAPGDSCMVWVTFTPTAKDNRTGVLAISDSDPANPQAIPLKGVGK